MDLSIVAVVTKDYLPKLQWVLPTWPKKREFYKVPLILFYNGLKQEQLEWVKEFYPQTTFIPWNMPDVSTKELAFSAFVFGAAKYVKTTHFVKIDADAYCLNDKRLFDKEDFKYDIVGHSWSYTKPGEWIDILNNYYDNTDKPIEKRRIHKHDRIASFVCLHKTDFIKKLAEKLGGRLPVPSHDTTVWYYANREGSWKGKNVKRLGLDNNSRWKSIRENICSSDSADNLYLNKELLKNIQIEITSACQLGCHNCDRACGLAKTNENMSLGQIWKFILESLELNHEWSRIDIIGGEPTLHPNLPTILKYLEIYKKRFPDTIIRLSTHGYGDFTKKKLEIIPKWVTIRNSAKTSKSQDFSPYNVAPVDLGIKRAKACSVPWRCGIALTRYGYFLCGAGASVCRVFGKKIGILNLKDVNAKALLEQRSELCSICGHSRSVDRKTITEQKISPSWEMALTSYKNHKMDLY